MKNYFIALLLTVILVLSSLISRHSRRPVLYEFPVAQLTEKDSGGFLYLFLFFSGRNCPPCLDIIADLNGLPVDKFKVFGVIPDNEITLEEEIRQRTGASFLFLNSRKFFRFKPLYAPSLYGVSRHGVILFILPATPGQRDYLKIFLIDFYTRAFPFLVD